MHLEQPWWMSSKSMIPQILVNNLMISIQWRIYIQKFLARAPPPPQQDQILSYLHMFSPKSACVRGWCPLQRGLAPPQREVLDPPLPLVTSKISLKSILPIEGGADPFVRNCQYTFLLEDFMDVVSLKWPPVSGG